MAVENRGTAKRPRWRYAFTIRGVRYRAAIPEARTQYEAERAEVEAKQAVYERRYGRPIGGRGLVDFVEKVYRPWARENKRSWKNEEYCLPTITAWFGGRTFAQVSPLLVEKFKRYLRESNTKKGTLFSPRYVNYFLQTLFRIFSLAVEYEEITSEDNPCKKVKKLTEDNRRERYLLDEEEPRLFEHLVGPREQLRPLVIVALGTGMRLGDQLNLLKSKVDFQRNLIRVPNSKTCKDYYVPMNPEVREVMLKLVREGPAGEYVFTNAKTGKPYTCVKRAFKTACRLAKIEGLRWHDLRHTFGTRMAEAGFSEATIAELMGHTDPATTRRYTHATDRAKREAVEAARPRTHVRREQMGMVFSIQK